MSQPGASTVKPMNYLKHLLLLGALIANTTTHAGLKIRAELDSGQYPAGIKVSDAELAAVNMKRASFHGDWNYTLLPTRKKK